jgi:hypothetical protein
MRAGCDLRPPAFLDQKKGAGQTDDNRVHKASDKAGGQK